MFRFVSVLALLVILVGLASADTFPTDVQRCKYSDGECLSKVVTNILRSYAKKGNRDLNLIPFDPLPLKNVVLDGRSDRPVNLEIRFKDAELVGISEGSVPKISGFTREPSNTVMEIVVFFPKITIKGPYSIKGKVLILPIIGQGSSKFNFENTTATAKVKITPVEKNGKTYVELAAIGLDLQPKKVSYYLGNLFNGDKALGDNMNKLLNENWKLVFDELKPLMEEAILKLCVHVANGVFSKTPYVDLFLPSS